MSVEIWRGSIYTSIGFFNLPESENCWNIKKRCLIFFFSLFVYSSMFSKSFAWFDSLDIMFSAVNIWRNIFEVKWLNSRQKFPKNAAINIFGSRFTNSLKSCAGHWPGTILLLDWITISFLSLVSYHNKTALLHWTFILSFGNLFIYFLLWPDCMTLVYCWVSLYACMACTCLKWLWFYIYH